MGRVLTALVTVLGVTLLGLLLSGPAPLPVAAIAPHSPIVLYDQYNSTGVFGTPAQVLTATQTTRTAAAADDFIVPTGESWSLSEIDVAGGYAAGTTPASSVAV